MLDRITGMNVFARAARFGSISAAARALGLSAAMATKHLDALEARLGVRLFQRSTRKLSLTEAGQQYLLTVNRLLPELEEVENMLASQRVEASGLLRLNSPLSFGSRYVAPLMNTFHTQHPNVTVELGLNDRVVDLIDEGWDLTIRTGFMRDSGLVSRKLTDCLMVVCGSPEYLQRAGVPRTIEDLQQHNCLGSTIANVNSSDVWRFGHKHQYKTVIKGTFKVNNGMASVAAAVSGLGLIYQPEFIVADALACGELRVVELDIEPTTLGGIHLVYSSRHAYPAKMRVMMDFLINAFEDKSHWAIHA